MGWNLLPQRPLSSSSCPTISEPKLSEECPRVCCTSSPPTRLDELKAELRALLSKNGGSTKDPQVVSVIDELVMINPCITTCANSSLFLGEFSALTGPNFPGRLKSEPGQEHVVQYSLGRMSFNIFQPNKLACTLRSIRNPVVSLGTTQDGKSKFSYPLVLDITIHAEDGDLPAILINEAQCYEHTDICNRLMVSFTGGTLLPTEEVHKDSAKLAIWSKTFEGAYQKADEERSYLGWIFKLFLKILMGLTYPTDESLAKHCFHFDMNRSPVGYLDVLYLDEELRITKGNRGTIVVVERSELQ
jgi:PAP_fibrillin